MKSVMFFEVAMKGASMKAVFALVLIATVAAAQDPCNNDQCRVMAFHVTGIETRGVTDTRESPCARGYCIVIRYEISGFTGFSENEIVYRAYCNDIEWVAGVSKGVHERCIQVEAGELYRVRMFATAIDFSINHTTGDTAGYTLRYKITSQREASGK